MKLSKKIKEHIKREEWIRIGNLGICCPICGKPDWCRVSKDGNRVLCSRVPVYSQEGTVHKIDENIEIKDREKYVYKDYTINWELLNMSYMKNCPFWRVSRFGKSRGVSNDSLIKLYMGFDGEFYTFPVFNSRSDVVGIQRQHLDHTKLMIAGSKIGVFIPLGFSLSEPVVITEGASDTAAALDLGLNVIGRMNNSTGNKIIKKIMNKSRARLVYIIADNDINRAGYDGAMKLAKQLSSGCPSKNIKVFVTPWPYKDLREWKIKVGLDAERFKRLING